MSYSDSSEAVSVPIGCDSTMSESHLRSKDDGFMKAGNKSTSEQRFKIDRDDISWPMAPRSSPMRIPSSPYIVTDCNSNAVLLCPANGMRHISAYCGIGRTPSDAWWVLPDIRASLKRHRQQLLRPCIPRHAASTSNSASSSSVNCCERLGFGSTLHALL